MSAAPLALGGATESLAMLDDPAGTTYIGPAPGGTPLYLLGGSGRVRRICVTRGGCKRVCEPSDDVLGPD